MPPGSEPCHPPAPTLGWRRCQPSPQLAARGCVALGVYMGVINTHRAVISLSFRSVAFALGTQDPSQLRAALQKLAVKKQVLVIAEITLVWSQPPAASPSPAVPRPRSCQGRLCDSSLSLGAGACEQRAPLMPSHNIPTKALGQTVPSYHTGERRHITWVNPSSPVPHLTQPTLSKTTLHLPCSIPLHVHGGFFHPHLLPVPADMGAIRCRWAPGCAMPSMVPVEGCPSSTSVTQRRLQGLLPPWVLQSPLLHPPIPLIILISKLRLGRVWSHPFLSTPSPGDSSPLPSLFSIQKWKSLCTNLVAHQTQLSFWMVSFPSAPAALPSQSHNLSECSQLEMCLHATIQRDSFAPH